MVGGGGEHGRGVRDRGMYAGEMATEVSGTHPAGIHSSSIVRPPSSDAKCSRFHGVYQKI